MKLRIFIITAATILCLCRLLWSQDTTHIAGTYARHNIPIYISVTFVDTTIDWFNAHYTDLSMPENYVITDSTTGKTFQPDKIEYDTTMVQVKHKKYRATVFLYSLTGYAPDHYFKVTWNDNNALFSTKGSLYFDDCTQAKISNVDIKPVFESKTIALDFKFANNILDYSTPDADGLLIKWNANGYIDFSRRDSVSNAEFNAEGNYPISVLRPHPYFIGKIGGEFSGNFTAADFKASAGVSILDQYLLPPILKFIGTTIFKASMPVPPPVLAVFGEAGVPWSREHGVGDSLLLRIAGEIDMNIPMGNGNYLNLYARGWIIKNSDTKSFVEFAYKKEITRDISVVLKWLNGSLPPLFQKGSNIMAGVSFLFPGL